MTTFIKLEKPIETHEGEVMQIELRDPKYGEYSKFGEPYTLQPTGDGYLYKQEHEASIGNYHLDVVRRSA